jgi:hypothetical protein
MMQMDDFETELILRESADTSVGGSDTQVFLNGGRKPGISSSTAMELFAALCTAYSAALYLPMP